MTAFEFTVVVWALSALAGFLGALTGLGGGVVVVPALTLALGVDMKYAIGASLVSVIATSSGAAAAYVKEGFSNIRIGMFLGIAHDVRHPRLRPALVRCRVARLAGGRSGILSGLRRDSPGECTYEKTDHSE